MPAKRLVNVPKVVVQSTCVDTLAIAFLGEVLSLSRSDYLILHSRWRRLKRREVLYNNLKGFGVRDRLLTSIHDEFQGYINSFVFETLVNYLNSRCSEGILFGEGQSGTWGFWMEPCE